MTAIATELNRTTKVTIF